ncbi:hypothetical protein P3342_007254 [Pyrenophora teres f. teres]|nr:hypothetical protein P3342_007254 [Pyrenophora teres f. teres]
MPEVRKKLFQTGYTAEEFEKIEVNLAAQALVSEDEDSSEDDLGPRIQVNSLSLGQLPDYVLVESSAGRSRNATALTLSIGRTLKLVMYSKTSSQKRTMKWA